VFWTNLIIIVIIIIIIIIIIVVISLSVTATKHLKWAKGSTSDTRQRPLDVLPGWISFLWVHVSALRLTLLAEVLRGFSQ
jgi:hypothetical protein